MVQRQRMQRPRRREFPRPNPLIQEALSPGFIPAPPTGETIQRTPTPGFDVSNNSVVPAQASPHVARELDIDLASRIHRQQEGGAEIDASTRVRLETGFGHSFRDVRIHADDEADTLNRVLDARAFTLGSHIFLSQDATSTGAAERDRVLAHELTHVVQQRGAAQHATLTVGPLDDPAEREATAAARQIGASGGRWGPEIFLDAPIQATPGRIQRQGRAPTQQPTLASLAQDVAELKEREADRDRQVAILNKKQAATRLDAEWRGKFGERLASYHQAIARITRGMDIATEGFNRAHEAQALADQIFIQAAGGLFALAFSAGFEWLYTAGMGRLGMSAARIQNSIELVENPANVAVAAGVNITAATAQEQNAGQGKAPGLGSVLAGNFDLGGGSATGFFARNAELLWRHTQGIEQAFVNRSQQLGKLTDAEWEQFDIRQQEATYRELLFNLSLEASGVEAMKEVPELANVIEKHLWALWLKRQHAGFIKAAARILGHDEASLERENPAALEGVGWELLKRMREIGVTAEAGFKDDVQLTGYFMMERDTFNAKMMAWANAYAGTITKGTPN